MTDTAPKTTLTPHDLGMLQKAHGAVDALFNSLTDRISEQDEMLAWLRGHNDVLRAERDRAVEAERLLREAHRVTVAENADLRVNDIADRIALQTIERLKKHHRESLALFEEALPDITRRSKERGARLAAHVAVLRKMLEEAP
jgi:hypothetical protein